MFHKHKWEIRGVQHWREMWCSTQVNITTDVLRVCTTCGKAKTKNLDGEWTLEQLRG